MGTEGGNRCLDAFTVALSQVSEGGEKRWYASTLELQLVSLEFCCACRSVPTLHVDVSYNSPGSLWYDRESQTRLKTHHTKKVLISSRVPIVRALRLTWRFPVEVLMENAAKELWKWLHCLVLQRSPSSAGLKSVVWPQGLKQLKIHFSQFGQPIGRLVLPPSLEQVSFGRWFNQPIAEIKWPASLHRLSLGDEFNQPIAEVEWPASLRHLLFGHQFNQPTIGIVWPASLQKLSLGYRYSQPLNEATKRLLQAKRVC